MSLRTSVKSSALTAGDNRDIRVPAILPPGISAQVAALDWTLTDPAGDLQTQITAASGGSTLTLGPYIYRALPASASGFGTLQTITCGKSLTITGTAGTSIRGSVWLDDNHWVQPWTTVQSEFWKSTVSTIRSSTGVSNFVADTASGSSRAIFAIDQVFYDHRPLRRMWGTDMPGSGEYSVDSFGYIILADCPKGHLVEVTSINNNLFSDNGQTSVTISLNNLDFRHCGSKVGGGVTQAMVYLGSFMNAGTADNGALKTVNNCTFMHAHGFGLGLYGSPGSSVTNSEFAYNGQGANWDQGAWTKVMVAISTQSVFSNNLLHHNGGVGYNNGNSAGGVKFSNTNNIYAHHNDVYANAGPGIWFDIMNTEATVQYNRFHHNTTVGAFMFEISGRKVIVSGANYIPQYRGGQSEVQFNIFWENGWHDNAVGNSSQEGAIFISTSENIDVSYNLLAWDYCPINTIWEHNRGVSGQGVPTGGVQLAGTVTKTATSAAVVGIGTAFVANAPAGTVITIPGTATEYFLVSSVTDDTHLTLNANAANTLGGQTAVVAPNANDITIHDNWIITEGNFLNATTWTHGTFMRFCAGAQGSFPFANTNVGAWANAYGGRCYGNTTTMDGNANETTWWATNSVAQNALATLNATHGGRGIAGASTASTWIDTANNFPSTAAIQNVINGTSALLAGQPTFQAFVVTAFAAGLLAYLPENGHGQMAGAQTAVSNVEQANYTPVRTAAYSIQDWERFVIADVTGGSFALTLPRSTRYNRMGRDELVIKRVDNSGNTLTVNTAQASDLLDANQVTTTVPAKGAAGSYTGILRLQSDGNNWWVTCKQ